MQLSEFKALSLVFFDFKAYQWKYHLPRFFKNYVSNRNSKSYQWILGFISSFSRFWGLSVQISPTERLWKRSNFIREIEYISLSVIFILSVKIVLSPAVSKCEKIEPSSVKPMSFWVYPEMLIKNRTCFRDIAIWRISWSPYCPVYITDWSGCPEIKKVLKILEEFFMRILSGCRRILGSKIKRKSKFSKIIFRIGALCEPSYRIITSNVKLWTRRNGYTWVLIPWRGPETLTEILSKFYF